MDYRTVTSPDDMERIVDLEFTVWGLDPIDAIPVNMLRLSEHNGGVIWIAETESQQCVGFSVSFPAKRDHEWLLWSHITGVHPAYQGQHIGYTLKQNQREWAADNGYDAIGWTFDPLQPRNAHFNMNILGAKAVQYHNNFYGVMRDAINQNGGESDRLEVRWAATPSQSDITSSNTSTEVFPLLQDKSNMPQISAFPKQYPDTVSISIPRDRAEAPHWQPFIRQAFHQAFDIGYCATQFDRSQRRYILKRT